MQPLLTSWPMAAGVAPGGREASWGSRTRWKVLAEEKALTADTPAPHGSLRHGSSFSLSMRARFALRNRAIEQLRIDVPPFLQSLE